MKASGRRDRIELREERAPRLPHLKRVGARHNALGRPVELRVAEEPGTRRSAATFVREMLELSCLDHPAFPTVLDRGLYKDRYFYAVPARDAPSLAELVDGGGLPAADRGRGVRQLAAAFAAAAARGVVLAPLLEDHLLWDALREQLWIRHHRLPEPEGGYAWARGAPAAVGEALRRATPEANVLQWGLLGFWILAGEPAHARAGGASLPELRPDLDPSVARLVQTCAGEDPAARPGNMAEVGAVVRLYPEECWTGSGAAGVEPVLDGPDAVLTTIADLEERGLVPRVLAGLEGGLERVRAGTLAIDLDLGGGVRLPGGGRTGAALGGAVALAAGISMLPEAEPPPPPEIEIAGSTMEQLRHSPRDLVGDPYIARLVAVEHVTPEGFRGHWGMLRTLAFQGRLPGEVGDLSRLERLYALFKEDPETACMGLEEVLEELREAVSG